MRNAAGRNAASNRSMHRKHQRRETLLHNAEMVPVLLLHFMLAPFVRAVRNETHRVPTLMVITTCHDPTSRSMFLMRWYDNVLDMCEHARVDTHWHIVAMEGRVQADVWAQKDMYCARNGAAVPVQWHLFPADVDIGLPSHAYKLLTAHQRDYDWFLIGEDDMDITYKHVLLYLHEWRVLQHTNYIPVMKRMEVDVHQVHPTSKPRAPHGLSMCSPERADGRLVLINGNAYIVGHEVNFYGAHYMVPQHFLIEALSKGWYPIEYPYIESREYHAGLWLRFTTGIEKVWPLYRMHAGMVHHMTNKYIQMWQATEQGGVGLLHILESINATVLAWDRVSWPWDRDAELRECLNNGGSFQLRYRAYRNESDVDQVLRPCT